MKIGIVYDLKDDYDINLVKSNDFTVLEEVILLSNILSQLGHEIKLINGIYFLIDNIKIIKESYDLLINMVEGYDSRNRESLVPALLELYKIPFIGSDCYANTICLDKYLAKLIAQSCGVQTPKYAVYIKNTQTIINDIPKTKQIVLKPTCGGSSDGLLLMVNDNNDIMSILKNKSIEFNQNILIEEYIQGTDISISLYGNSLNGYEIIGGVEILDKNNKELILYDQTYKENYDVKKISPRWNNSTKEKTYKMCIEMSNAIDLRGFFRFDFRLYFERW